ncbi:MAG: Bug family tripartite tricarboxylate transporter substrate binding protein [Lautropia sp.]
MKCVAHALRLVQALLLVGLCGAAPAFAQAPASDQAPAFPTRPVHLVVGFSAGGVIDGFARQLAPRLSAALGQPVVVDNRPGANGVLAMQSVAAAPADGHTLMFGAAGNISLNELLYNALPYQLERDFVPVTQVNSVALLLMTRADLPVGDVAGLITLLKREPGKINYASTGTGSSPQLAAEMFNSMAGVKSTNVPYKGSGQAITDLIAGQVDMMLDAIAIGMPHVRSGKLKALATTGTRRSGILPDLPTVAETLPGYEVTNWFGVLAPKGTPPAVVRRIQSEIRAAIAAPDLRDKMRSEGMEPVGSTPEEFAAFIRREQERWGRVIKQAGIRVE